MHLGDFAAVPASVARVRSSIREFLADHPLVDDVVLVASELASNVVRHAKTEYSVGLEVDSGIRLDVSDGSSIVPAVEDLTADQRGLRIVMALTADWGVSVTESGKTVWATFSVDS